VDNVTGSVSLTFPLAALPEGRGGLAALGLRYSSAVYETHLTRETTSLSGAYVQSHMLRPAGGWTYSTSYEVLLEARPSDSTCLPTAEDRRRQRYWLRLPDGSRHALRLYRPSEYDAPNDQINAFADTNGDGFYAYNINGSLGPCADTISPVPHSQATVGTTWFTTDGSFIRVKYLEVTACDPQTNPALQIFFRDGLKVKGCSLVGSVLEDRNGNTVTMTGTLAQPSLGYTGQLAITDSANRQITLTYGTGGDSSPDSITYPGHNGNVTAKVYRKNVLVGGFKYRCNIEKDCNVSSSFTFQSSPPTDSVFNIAPIAVPNVYRIEYPADESGGNQFRYDFDYGETATSACHPLEVANCFWGELRQVTLSTLKDNVTTPHFTVNYSYKYDKTNRFPGYGPPELNLAPVDNPVVKRSLTYTSKYDSTTNPETEDTYYSFGNVSSEIKSYDISGTAYRISKTEFYDPRVLSDYRHGLAHTIYRPDGAVVTRTYAANTPTNPSLNDTNNAFVRSETVSHTSAGSATTTFSHDKNGNVTFVQGQDFDATVLRKVTRTYTEATGNYDVAGASTHSTAYWHPSAPRMLSLMSTEEITNGVNSVFAATKNCYASISKDLKLQARWDSTKGAFTTSASLADCDLLTAGERTIRTLWTYDQYGNVETTASPRGVITTISRNQCSLPSTVSVGNFSRTYTHNCNSGLLDSEADLNAQSTTYTYDNIGRVKTINQAQLRKTSIDYDDLLRCVRSKSDVDLLNDQKKIEFTHYDPLGRIRLTRLTNSTGASCSDETAGIKVQRRYHYNTSSDASVSGFRWELVSNPYLTTASTTNDPATLKQDSAKGWTLTKHDKAGRPLSIRYIDGGSLATPWHTSAPSSGTTTLAYDGNKTTISDAASKSRVLHADALGRTTKVVEAGAAETLYSYDPLGNLTSVKQATDSQQASPNSIRTFTYSSLSRLTQVASPETLGQAILFSYDADGNLAGRKDPRGALTCYGNHNPNAQPLPCDAAYTDLGLLTKKTYVNTSPAIYSVTTPTVTFEYSDPAVSNSKGRLTKVSNSVSETHFLAYDGLGRITSHRQRMGAKDYTFSYGFNLQDTMTTRTYPSGRTVTYATDALSRVTAVTGQVGTANTQYAASFTYAPHGAVHSFQLGDWYNQTCFNSRLQVGAIRRGAAPQNGCTAVSGDVLRLDYTYGSAANNGNPDSHTVKRPHGAGGADVSWQQTYTFDAYNRLDLATETGGWTQDYVFDRVGNRALTGSSYAPVPAMSPVVSPATEAAVATAFPSNRWPGGSLYDEAGNVKQLLLQSAHSYKYDAENRLVEAQVPSGGGTVVTTYFYDGEGRRVKASGAGETLFLYDAFGELAVEHGVPALMTQTLFVTQDVLGSTRLVTDRTNTQTACSDYLPFGEEIPGNQFGRTHPCFGSGQYPSAPGLLPLTCR